MSVTLGVALGDVDVVGVSPDDAGPTLLLQLPNYVLDLLDSDANGFKVQTFDPGSPTVRESVSALPAQDGQFDQTMFFGPRVVAMTVVVVGAGGGSPTASFDAMGPFLAPSARPVLLYSTAPDVPQRQLTLRVSQFSNPAINPNYSAASFQWVASDPIALSPTTRSVDIAPGGDSSGRAYPRTYPRTYPTSTGGSGIGLVPVGGNFITWPLLRIFGPITDPLVQWLASDDSPIGPQIAFTGLTIAAGDYLDVDTKAKTVLLNSDPGANRFSSIDFANTQFGPLQPASTNALRFSGSATNPSTLMTVFYSDAFLQ